MSTPLSDDDRDLRLVRRLDASAPADGTDPLHDALRALQPEAASVDKATSERLWARIDEQIATRPATEDRAPLRLVPRHAMRWAAAAGVVLALGAALWLAQRPEVAAIAASQIVTWDAPDGSTITLRPHSRLVRLDDRAYRLEGEAFFSVATDPEHPFTVEAGPGTVRVLGTRFDVSTWGSQTDVFVEEGRVEVRADADAVVLNAGEAATADAAGVATLDAPSAAAFLDWQRGEAVFERASVRRVADEIGQHFGVAVTLPDDVARESVSGVIALESPEQALGDLGRILGGRFERHDGGYRFARP